MRLQENTVCTEAFREWKAGNSYGNVHVLHHNAENWAPHTLHSTETIAISLCKTALFFVDCVFPPLVLFNTYNSILNPISSSYLKFRTNTKLINVLPISCLPQILLCINFLLLHTNYHKLDGLRQSTMIISQFPWGRSPTTS